MRWPGLGLFRLGPSFSVPRVVLGSRGNGHGNVAGCCCSNPALRWRVYLLEAAQVKAKEDPSVIKPKVHSPKIVIKSADLGERVGFSADLYDWPPNAEVDIHLLNQPRVPTPDDPTSVIPGPTPQRKVRVGSDGILMSPSGAMNFYFDQIPGFPDMNQVVPEFMATDGTYSDSYGTQLEMWYRP